MMVVSLAVVLDDEKDDWKAVGKVDWLVDV